MGCLTLHGGQEGLRREGGRAACCQLHTSQKIHFLMWLLTPSQHLFVLKALSLAIACALGKAGRVGCGPGPQDDTGVLDRTGGPLQPWSPNPPVSPRYQSTLRTLLRGRIGAPSLGPVGQQRGAHLQVDWAVVLRQACRPIPEPALGLGPSVEAKSSGRGVLGLLPGGQAVGHL